MHRRITAAVVAGALLVGGAGAAFLIPNLVAAADPSASPTATPSARSSTGSSSSGSTSGSNSSSTQSDCVGGGSMHGGPGMGAEDITAASEALGMSDADLTTALQSGQTIADVAESQGIDVHTVVDAMVAAEKAEIQAQVDSGAITQSQADQMIANLTQHETDEVNGTFTPGMGGPGRPGRGGHGQPNQPPANPSNGSSSGTSSGSTSVPTTSDSTSS